MAVAIPPDLSNASGKFNKPAPNVALIIKKIVPIEPIPKIYIKMLNTLSDYANYLKKKKKGKKLYPSSVWIFLLYD
jgi:hypothetical protein